MNRKTILDSKVAKDFLKQFKVTNVVAGRGHDCGGLICYLKLKSKTLVDFHDDGWGGQPEIRYENNGMEILKQKLKEVNYAQLMFDNGWDFMKSPDRIDLDTQVEDVISALVKLKDEEKLMKKTERAFIFGTDFSHSIVSWKGKKLAEIPQHVLQRTYDKYKTNLKDGQKFFNTNEQLLKLGINP